MNDTLVHDSLSTTNRGRSISEVRPRSIFNPYVSRDDWADLSQLVAGDLLVSGLYQTGRVAPSAVFHPFNVVREKDARGSACSSD